LVDRLEQRIHDLESSSKMTKSIPENGSSMESTLPAIATSSSAEPSSSAASEKNSTVNLLISKSQTLLKLDKADEALDCLEEALELDPENAEALVRKGATLERMQRLQEAIECYDRAIASDSSMIMAYLYKGGVFNRLERHSEALACYEQALRPGKPAITQTATAH
jgi:tetratricopeptide (TPR) repeat protein